MKKIAAVFLAGMFVFGAAFLAIAEEAKGDTKSMMQGGMMGQRGMMGEEAMMMGKGKMMGMGGMCGMMMNSVVMGKSLVATSDGGVIVLIGNKLQKYDKDLTLKKEVEIKMDMEGMQKMMMQMMEKCPMQEKMMEDGTMNQAMDKSKKEVPEMPEQESHH